MNRRNTSVWLLLSALGLAFWSCRISGGSPDKEYFLTLQVDDTLFTYDTVFIAIVDPATHETLEVIWNDTIADSSRLQGIRTRIYRDGPADIRIEAIQGDSITYRRIIHYTGAGATPITEVLPSILSPAGIRKQIPIVDSTLVLYTLKDAVVDTNQALNNGFSGVYPFPGNTGATKLLLFRFDRDRVDRDSLKSGILRFLTYGSGAGWTGKSVPITFRVYRIQSDWIEGTGNWYYNRGGWRNGGQELFANHGIPEAVKAASTDPNPPTGVSGSDRMILRPSNLTLIQTEIVALAFTTLQGAGPILPAGDLTRLDLDLTAYLKSPDTGQDFGWMVTVEGIPEDCHLSSFTKEVGNGTLGPSLRLRY